MNQFYIDDFTKENQGGLLQRIFKKYETLEKMYNTIKAGIDETIKEK
ncbi:hypothetical protein QJR30_13650 [Paraclostridium sordellii]|nr:hypothetical protein [Paeniclostridium sordellii]